ncbi:MAG: hypothetical protein JWQ38_2451 [Flavipsychrobacter sp.]|nr:hypothetical protein [Flavipsychrobacter sp.]
MHLPKTKSGVLACFLLLQFCAAYAQVHTFSFTGTSQSWTVPPAITSIAVDVVGASGGRGLSVMYGTTFFNNAGGGGGRVQCRMAVTPGMVLQIYVGGKGDTSSPGTGGFNGGGSGLSIGWGGGGGGGSDIRIAPYSLNDRVIVAGGGGGGGLVCPGTIDILKGGPGGGTIGVWGQACYGITQGKGGTDTSGGIGGYNGTIYAPSGALGMGGNGAPGYYGSAGGGGGYYGGGGSVNAGGGGGSSRVDTILASGIIHTTDYNNAGNGMVTITELSVVGVNTVEPEDITLFPNPATDELMIYTGATPYNTCYVSNTLGQVVMRKDIVSTQTKLILNGLPGGMYYLTLSGAYATNVLRFIKK